MSVLLDVGIGMIVVFLLFSVAVSGVNEWMAQAYGRRGEYLRLGMLRLINDDAIFHRVLHHPLIGSLYRDKTARAQPPSYVDARNFALAIADVLVTRAAASNASTAAMVAASALASAAVAANASASPATGGAVASSASASLAAGAAVASSASASLAAGAAVASRASASLAAGAAVASSASQGATTPPITPQLSVGALRAALGSAPLRNSPLRAALIPILDRSADDLETALTGIETWFNSGMDRVQGWYKAYTHRVLFALGLAMAASCNVDAIDIFQALNQSPQMRAAFVASAQQIVQSGQVAGIDLASAANQPLTPTQAQALRALSESLMAAAPATLPIGYSCLRAPTIPAQSAASAAAASVQSTAAAPAAGSAPVGAGFAASAAAARSETGASAIASAFAATPWQACRREFQTELTGRSWSAWILKLIGWSLSALAGTLGATYWFDLLTKAINIRGSGPKPTSKDPAAAAT